MCLEKASNRKLSRYFYDNRRKFFSNWTIVTKIIDRSNFSNIPKASSFLGMIEIVNDKLRMIEIVNDKLGSSNLRHL